MLSDGGEVLGHVAALDEVTEHRRTEEALAGARRESEEHLQEWSASKKKAEEALAARAEFAKAAAEKDGTARALRTELDRLRDEAAATRQAHDRLQELLAEKGGNEESLRKEMERLKEDAAALRQSQDRLQALLAQRDANEESLRQELERLGREAAEAREAESRARAALAERGTAEESLRQELERLEREVAETRDVRDRLQALLTAKADTEGSLRQEIERLQGEATARRQAEEAHGHVRALLGEKEKSEESLRQELARLQDDVSRRQQAEEQLRRDKEFLEGVLDGSPAGIFAHDRDGRCRVWNRALERLLGRARTDALGRTASELFPAVDPDGKHVEAPPTSENGAVRDELAAAGVIGRSELLESAHAPIHDQAGEVVGGVALVRELPMPAPREEPTLVTLEGHGADRPVNGARGHGVAATRLRDIDWLAFN
jgi:PAS domain S-box-containing protein